MCSAEPGLPLAKAKNLSPHELWVRIDGGKMLGCYRAAPTYFSHLSAGTKIKHHHIFRGAVVVTGASKATVYHLALDDSS